MKYIETNQNKLVFIAFAESNLKEQISFTKEAITDPDYTIMEKRLLKHSLKHTTCLLQTLLN